MGSRGNCIGPWRGGRVVFIQEGPPQAPGDTNWEMAMALADLPHPWLAVGVRGLPCILSSCLQWVSDTYQKKPGWKATKKLYILCSSLLLIIENLYKALKWDILSELGKDLFSTSPTSFFLFLCLSVLPFLFSHPNWKLGDDFWIVLSFLWIFFFFAAKITEWGHHQFGRIPSSHYNYLLQAGR